jgi:trafficking protein particle complex subunit 3
MRCHSRCLGDGIAIFLASLTKVQLDVKAEFVSDILRGHDRTEMRITFNRFIEEEVPAGDD